MFNSIKEMIKSAEDTDLPLHEFILRREMEISENSREKIIERLKKSLAVMRSSLEHGLQKDVELPIKEAEEQSQKLKHEAIFLNEDIKEAVYWALSIAEYNSGMGLICAAPTAGAAGILPATMFKGKEMLGKTDEELLHSFIVGSAVGVICGNRGSISGSEAGCQAEVGVAAAMAAAAIVYMNEGTLQQIAESVALSLKNILGLVCDPVAGLVISPCIKRNAIGVVNAFLAAEMALSGVTSIIPADEVINAMMDIGQKLPADLKETGQGGVAATSTGEKIRERLYNSEAE